MGNIAGRNAAIYARDKNITEAEDTVNAEKIRVEAMLGSDSCSGKLNRLRHLLKEVMWYEVGIIRTYHGLIRATEEIKKINTTIKTILPNSTVDLIKHLELEKMLLVSEIVARASLEREESRGAHFRADYPLEDRKLGNSNIVSNRRSDINIEKLHSE
jgi:fumarate reductase flavoprotein subunit